MVKKTANASQNYSSVTNLPLILSAQAYFIINFLKANPTTNIIWGLSDSRDLNKAGQLVDFFKKDNQLMCSQLIFPQDFLVWQAKAAPAPSVLLVAPEHWELALPKASSIKQNTIKLKVGSNLKPTHLKNLLWQAGYEPGPLPSSNGWWRQQGGALWLAAGDYWRLLWQGNFLESITRYNPLTQAIIESVNELTIYPRLLPPAPQLTLKNYLNPANLIINPPSGVALNDHTQIITCEVAKTSPLGGVPRLVNLWEQINNYLKTQLPAGYTIKILSTEISYLKTKLIFKDKLDWREITDDLAQQLEGFTDDINKIIYLSDRELSGVRRHHFITNLASYDQLKPGDYVVHIDHGIGRFNNLVSQIIDEQPRDYLLVDYADNDKLYIPIEHTDRLSRYLGKPEPPLQKLSSDAWFKITRKVKAETLALASELIKLYAQRSLAQVKPMVSYPEETVLAASFPWPLTSDQLKAWAEIAADLSGHKPTDRLICGDVGFGKTELGVRAAWRTVLNGYQVAVLAPTTLLAQQHYDTFSQRLKSFGVNLGLLSRQVSSSAQKQTLKLIEQGKIDIIIGTHSLLSNNLKFHRLGLLIIDEEQRFGVRQKEKLKNYKPNLHVLSLSATPIPRTLHLAVSSLRDMSLITTPPGGRQKINTTITTLKEEIIKQAITSEIERQGQIYYLVNRIADLPRAAAGLHKLIPQAKVGIIHGRLPARAAAQVMRNFDNQQLDILLATSIIENGLDLPNVNTLIVEKAENFGLTDLYQLKGRVGRNSSKAYAYFLVSPHLTDSGQKRLQALRQADSLGSGLSLALKDMELRGVGAILGRQQHGQVAAVGVHLYGQLLAQAIEEIKTGQPIPAIPEVLLRLPLAGFISPKLIPDELDRIQIYQRLAGLRTVSELKPTATELIGRPLTDTPADRSLKNLLTLLEFKLLSERARLREISCQRQGYSGQFLLRFLELPAPNTIRRLQQFDPAWHQVGESWQAKYPLAAGLWINWLKASLNCLITSQ